MSLSVSEMRCHEPRISTAGCDSPEKDLVQAVHACALLCCLYSVLALVISVTVKVSHFKLVFGDLA
jgi:hypothetical protein